MLKRSLLLVLFAALFTDGIFLSAQESFPYDSVPSPGDAAFIETPPFVEVSSSVEASSSAEDGPFDRNVRWYRSDTAGMALEFIPSRLVALRNEFCLCIERVRPSETPALLSPHYDAAFIVEKRTLYEKRKESRLQWIFRDGRGLARLVASGNAAFWEDGGENGGKTGEETGKETGKEEKRSGFIEFRDNEGLIYREFRFEEDLSEWQFLFFYRGGALLRAETWFKAAPAAREEETEAEEKVKAEEAVDEDDIEKSIGGEGNVATEDKAEKKEREFVPVSTDYYLYSRVGSLRSIDRLLHEGANPSRVVFPRIGAGFFTDDEMMTYSIAHNSRFLSGIHRSESAKINYTLDGRGRILSEVWKNEDDEVLGEFTNNWSGDRLRSILWKSPDEERLVEYEYDSAGNRVLERNYNHGVLERRVTSRGDLDTEEIYMRGNLILRAVWDKGVKIFEERVPLPGGRRR